MISGNRMPSKSAAWRKASLNRKVSRVLFNRLSPSAVRIDVFFTLMDISSRFRTTYLIYGSGDISITGKLIQGSASLPELPRFGMVLELPKDFNQLSYLGRGPHENYCDRNTGAFVGLYSGRVEDQYFPYISPQENGTRTDIRWLALSNGEVGLLFSGKPIFSASALPYTGEDLTQESRGSKHTSDITPRDFITLCLDLKQRGVGGDDSWGATPHSQYCLPAMDYIFSYRIKPFMFGEDLHRLGRMGFYEDFSSDQKKD